MVYMAFYMVCHTVHHVQQHIGKSEPHMYHGVHTCTTLGRQCAQQNAHQDVHLGVHLNK